MLSCITVTMADLQNKIKRVCVAGLGLSQLDGEYRRRNLNPKCQYDYQPHPLDLPLGASSIQCMALLSKMYTFIGVLYSCG